MKTARHFRIAFASLFAFLLQVTFSAGQNDAAVAKFTSDYVGNVLTLRKFYKGNQLRFRNDGSLIGSAETGPWTLEGRLTVKQIQVRDGVLIVEGRRAIVGFDGKAKRPVIMPEIPIPAEDAADPAARERIAKLQEFSRERDVRIEIELPTQNFTQAEVPSSLNKVFLRDNESMLEVVPIFWRYYIADIEGTPGKEPPSSIVFSYLKPGNGIFAPRPISSPDPDYSEVARLAKYQGTLVLALNIDSDGKPVDIQVASPLGFGLDEKAVEAVNRWKFEAATKNSSPIPVRVNVQVTFHLY